MATREKICGGGEIRTPGTFQYDGFQDRSIKPLWHSSKSLGKADFVKRGAKVSKRPVFKNLAPSFYLKVCNYPCASGDYGGFATI